MVAYVLYCALGLALFVAVVSEGDRRPDHLLVLAPAVVVNIWTERISDRGLAGRRTDAARPAPNLGRRAVRAAHH
jgi:hypothetical protein